MMVEHIWFPSVSVVASLTPTVPQVEPLCSFSVALTILIRRLHARCVAVVGLVCVPVCDFEVMPLRHIRERAESFGAGGLLFLFLCGDDCGFSFFRLF